MMALPAKYWCQTLTGCCPKPKFKKGFQKNTIRIYDLIKLGKKKFLEREVVQP